MTIRTLPYNNLIARAHEAIIKRLLVRLFVVEIPKHDRRRPHMELSGLIVSGNLITLGRDDANLDPRQQGTGRSEPDVAGAAGADDRRCLGQAVALPDLPAWVESLEVFGGLLAQGRGAGEYCLDAAEVEFGHCLFVFGHEDDDRRYLACCQRHSWLQEFRLSCLTRYSVLILWFCMAVRHELNSNLGSTMHPSP